MQSPVNYFDQVAATWDDNPIAAALKRAVAEAILSRARPSPDSRVLDYGCGTGLVSFLLAPHVGTVTAADSSSGMLQVLAEKVDRAGMAKIRPLRFDLETDALPDERFDLVVVNMTLHHIGDTRRALGVFHSLLRPGGSLCLSDLDPEPGVFHSGEAAATVRHFGFDRGELQRTLEGLGYEVIETLTAHTIRRPIEDGTERDFPVFLMVGRRPLG